MKKILSLFLCLIFCVMCSACSGDNVNFVDDTTTPTNSTLLLVEQENVKISFTGVSDDIGVGEGLLLLIENSRNESIIVNITEVSLNDVMQTVIQPQMPMHLTSSGKKSTQPFIFANAKIKGAKTQFKIKVMNENFEEIFETDFVEVNL